MNDTFGHEPLSPETVPVNVIGTGTGVGAGVGCGDGAGTGEGAGDGDGDGAGAGAGVGDGVGAGAGAGAATASCDTTYVRPPALSVPEREPPVFAATAIRIVPDAEPLRAPGNDSHAASTVAFHEQPLSVVSCTSSVPPSAEMPSPDRLNENEHAAAACVTGKRCVSTTSSALRGAGAGLLATV